MTENKINIDTLKDDSTMRCVVKLLETAPVYGLNLSTLRQALWATYKINIGHDRLHKTLLAMCNDGTVRRTPATCLWMLA